MTRLIDADKLHRYEMFDVVNWRDIEAAETVEAIPVEFIRRWVLKYPWGGIYNLIHDWKKESEKL